MRVVLIGASSLALAVTNSLLENGHDVVIVERDPDVADQLAGEVDCGVVCGDGSRPAVLREVGPEATDFLFCLSDSDQDNIIAALVGRRLGFDRIVAQVRDPEYEAICAELEVGDTIVPDQEVGQALADLVDGIGRTDLSSVVRGGIRFHTIACGPDCPDRVDGLDLPGTARAIAVLRDGKTRIADADTDLREGDRVLVLTPKEHLAQLRGDA